jgi:hypothetical protein
MKTYRNLALAAVAVLALAGYVNTNQAGNRNRTNRIDSGLVRMEMTMPATATLGSEIMVDLQAVAVAHAGNVVILFETPSAASYVRSEPAATVEGRNLTWKVGSLIQCEAITLKVWLKADKEGPLVGVAGVTAEPRMFDTTLVK